MCERKPWKRSLEIWELALSCANDCSLSCRFLVSETERASLPSLLHIAYVWGIPSEVILKALVQGIHIHKYVQTHQSLSSSLPPSVPTWQGWHCHQTTSGQDQFFSEPYSSIACTHLTCTPVLWVSKNWLFGHVSLLQGSKSKVGFIIQPMAAVLHGLWWGRRGQHGSRLAPPGSAGVTSYPQLSFSVFILASVYSLIWVQKTSQEVLSHITHHND